MFGNLYLQLNFSFVLISMFIVISVFINTIVPLIFLKKRACKHFFIMEIQCHLDVTLLLSHFLWFILLEKKQQQQQQRNCNCKIVMQLWNLRLVDKISWNRKGMFLSFSSCDVFRCFEIVVKTEIYLNLWYCLCFCEWRYFLIDLDRFRMICMLQSFSFFVVWRTVILLR